MAYLYQAIMNVPGLSGSSYDRQKQLYERLGSPMGGYRGTYDQNIWLLNQVNRGNTGGGGGGSQPQQQQSRPSGPSYEDIVRAQEDAARRAAEERRKRGEEQLNIWNSFMKNPNFFDEMLARKMAEEKFNRYYNTLLEEFARPLQQRIQQSKEKESQVLEELTRRRTFGEQEQKQDLAQSLEQAKEGFAGSGLYGSGSARRALARKRLTGEESIADFIAKSKAEEENTKLESKQQQEGLETEINLEKGRYFGEGRQVQQEVSKDVSTQREEAKKNQARRAWESLTSRFGADIYLTNLPDFLT